MDAGISQRPMSKRTDGLDMGSGRHLRYHTPEPGVCLDL